VCGALRSGGTVPKPGLYRLHAGEKVFTKKQLAAAGKVSKTKKAPKRHRKKKGCKCKH
jgi:hypothetical protein